jgi:hypothetical protein
MAEAIRTIAANASDCDEVLTVGQSGNRLENIAALPARFK